MDDFFFSSDMLFKDVDFPATEESLVRHGKSPTGQIQWKRPGVSVGTLNVRMEYTGSMWGGQCGKVCVDTTVWESLLVTILWERRTCVLQFEPRCGYTLSLGDIRDLDWHLVPSYVDVCWLTVAG